MTIWTDVDTFADGQMMGAFDFKRWVRDNPAFLHDRGMLQRVRLHHDDSLVTVGNAITTTVLVTAYNNFYAYQNPAANGDTFTQSVSLSAGAYQLFFEYVKATTGGILTVDLDGRFIASFDFYAGSTTVSRGTGSAIWIDENKRYTLTFTIVGQNASSSGYDARISAMYFKPVQGDS